MDGITHAMRRERWKAIIKECNDSGMKKIDWLAAHNINPETYYNWQRKLRMEIGTELVITQNNALTSVQNEADFCQITAPVTKPETAVGKTTAIISAGNLNIEVREGISDSFLIRLMRAASNVYRRSWHKERAYIACGYTMIRSIQISPKMLLINSPVLNDHSIAYYGLNLWSNGSCISLTYLDWFFFAYYDSHCIFFNSH